MIWCEESEQNASASVPVVLSPACRNPRAFHQPNLHGPNPFLQQVPLGHKPSLVVLSRAWNFPMLQVLHSCLATLPHRFHGEEFGGPHSRNASTGTDVFLWFGFSKGEEFSAITKHSTFDVPLQNRDNSFNQEKSRFLIPHRKLKHQSCFVQKTKNDWELLWLQKIFLLGSMPCVSPL